MQKEIIICIYDSGYNWAIMTQENGENRIVNRYDNDLEESENPIKLTEVETLIADKYIEHNELNTKEIIEKLQEQGYDVIICEDGCINLYKKENKQ